MATTVDRGPASAAAALHVLIVEDQPADVELIVRALARDHLGCTTVAVSTLQDLSEQLAEETFDVILADVRLDGFSGADVLAMARERCPEVPVIVVSGVVSDEQAVALVKAGAADYVLKDHLPRLPVAIRRALAEAADVRQRALLEDRVGQASTEAAATLVLLDALQAAAPVGLGFVDRDLRVIRANRELLSLLEWEDTSPLGLPIARIARRRWTEVVAPCQRVMATGAPLIGIERTFVLARAPERARWVMCSHFPAMVDDQVIGVGIALVDVTERRDAEERASAVIDALVDPLLIMSPTRDDEDQIVDYRVDYANPAGCELIGSPPGSFSGQPLGELLPSAAPALVDAFTQVIETGEPFAHESFTLEGSPGRLVRGPVVVDIRAVRSGNSVVVSARDISERKAMERALARSEERFRSLVQTSTDVILTVDRAGRILSASKAGASALGYDAEALVGTTLVDLIHPEDADWVRSAFQDILEHPGVAVPRNYRIRHATGRWVWVESVANNLLHDPAVDAIVLNARDVTDRVEAQRVIADERRALELIARGSSVQSTIDELVKERDAHGAEPWCAVRVLPRAGHADGWSAAPRAAMGFLDACAALPAGGDVSPTARALAVAGAVVALRRDGTADGTASVTELEAPLPASTTVTDFGAWPAWERIAERHGIAAAWVIPVDSADGGPPIGTVSTYAREARLPTAPELAMLRARSNLVALAVDRAESVELLAYQALHDLLTGLPNRALLTDRLDHELHRGQRAPGHTAVLFLDLDGFKPINDTLGHAVGDEVLRQVAGRLVRAIRPGDTVARFGGDEFVVLCPEVADAQVAGAVAGRILATFAEPFDLEAGPRSLTASVGIALSDGSVEDPEVLIRDADAAMYRAKTRGRRRVEV